MNTLIDNLNSEYLGASRFFYSRKAAERIYVYVESYDDIPFWRSVFSDFENSQRCFEIMVPSATTLIKGKKKVLDLIPSAGKNLILCIDSDYDYLLQDATETSRIVNREKYVFQTYTYSIENYYCLADHLYQTCAKAVLCDKKLIDWCRLLEDYSKIIYRLFLWSVLLYKLHKESCFSISNFCSVVRLPENMDPLNMDKVFASLGRRVDCEIKRLEQIYPEQLPAVIDLSGQLKELGVSEKNTYLFIHGHTMMEDVLLKIMIPVCNRLKKENIEHIKTYAKSEEDKRNNLNYYYHKISPVENIITSMTTYKTAELFQKIQNDICDYIKESF